jgi:hypothetical protein
VRRRPAGDLLRSEDDLLVLGSQEVRAAVLVAGQRRAVALREEVEDHVPALDDLALGWHDERDLVGRAVALCIEVAAALDDGIPDQVVVRGRLRQPGEDRRLGDGQVVQIRHPEIGLGRGLHAVRLVAVVILVQVCRDDLFLALAARERLGQPDRLDDLLELSLDLALGILNEVLIEQALAHELLGDRRRAATATAEAVDAGRDDRERVEAGVVPERLVLDRGLRVDHDGRNVVELDDLAACLADPGQFDLTGAVVDHGFLLRDEVVQLVRITQAARDRAEPGDRRRGDQQGEGGEEEPDDDGNHAGARWASTLGRSTLHGPRVLVRRVVVHGE